MARVVRRRKRRPKPRVDPAVVENIRWFSRFSPAEKIRVVEHHKRIYRKLKSLKGAAAPGGQAVPGAPRKASEGEVGA